MKNPSAEITEEAIRLVEKYNGFEYAGRLLESEISKAKQSISFLPESEAKDLLLILADYMALRKK